jgi:SAM-dependent methyltransferase
VAGAVRRGCRPETSVSRSGRADPSAAVELDAAEPRFASVLAVSLADAHSAAEVPLHSLSPLVGLLRCLQCRSALQPVELASQGGYPDLGPDGRLECSACGSKYPVIGGTPRMLRAPLLAELKHRYPRARCALEDRRREASEDAPELAVKRDTAASFAYEWKRFGVLRDEWRKNFLDYMRPLAPDWFAGKLLLDVGTGSGRHSYWASQLGARVAAVDLGASIDVARANLPRDALTVEADAEDLPFSEGTFDLVMLIGVLHHLPDPRGALISVSRRARPGGLVRLYLYWQPPWRWHRSVLKVVSAGRRVTVRMPHWLLHFLCVPLAALLFGLFVLPYRFMRGVESLRSVAERMPLKTYADYSFGVCVNDQFDRFSAPLERRYEREGVEQLLAGAGLVDTRVTAHHGWLGAGRRPAPA